MKKLALFLAVSACFLLMSVDAHAQTKTRVRFPAGTHGTAVKGKVRGYAYRDYVVGASGGQSMNVSIDASNSSTVFTIFTPAGSNPEEAAETNGYRGKLSDSGDYVIRVLMMRSAARRKGAVSNYTLKISIK